MASNKDMSKATTTGKAQELLAKYAVDLAKARLENRRLRARIEPKHGYHRNTRPRILREAKETALRILVAQANGEPISREEFKAVGISTTKRYWGIGLLRYARIMERTSTQFLIDDFVTAEQRLECKYNELVLCPNALEKLRLYLPKSMAYMYKVYP